MAVGILTFRGPRVVVFALFVVAILSGTVQAEAQMTKDDLNSLVDALRATGYHLFANAIQLTGIRDLIVSGNSFTFFAPPDADVYDLDVASPTAADYIQSIQHHVVVLRFSYSTLQGLPQGSNLDTLLPHGSVRVAFNDSGDGAVTVDGVRIAFRDLYSDNRMVVHGVDGVLNRTGFVPSTSKDPVTLGGHYPEANSSALSPSDGELPSPSAMDEIVLLPAPAPPRHAAGFLGNTSVGGGSRTPHHHRGHHRSDSDDRPPQKPV